MPENDTDTTIVTGDNEDSDTTTTDTTVQTSNQEWVDYDALDIYDKNLRESNDKRYIRKTGDFKAITEERIKAMIQKNIELADKADEESTGDNNSDNDDNEQTGNGDDTQTGGSGDDTPEGGNGGD